MPVAQLVLPLAISVCSFAYYPTTFLTWLVGSCDLSQFLDTSAVHASGCQIPFVQAREKPVVENLVSGLGSAPPTSTSIRRLQLGKRVYFTFKRNRIS